MIEWKQKPEKLYTAQNGFLIIMIVVLSNQRKAKTNHNFFKPKCLPLLIHSSGNCVRLEKQASDEVKARRHLLSQKIKRPESWKSGDKSPRKRCWQFLNSQGICRRASYQQLQATWSCHTKFRTNHLRNYKGRNTPHKMKKRNSVISAVWKKNKKKLWENWGYLHKLEKRTDEQN